MWTEILRAVFNLKNFDSILCFNIDCNIFIHLINYYCWFWLMISTEINSIELDMFIVWKVDNIVWYCFNFWPTKLSFTTFTRDDHWKILILTSYLPSYSTICNAHLPISKQYKYVKLYNIFDTKTKNRNRPCN